MGGDYEVDGTEAVEGGEGAGTLRLLLLKP